MNILLQKVSSIPKRRWVRINPFMSNAFFKREYIRVLAKDRGKSVLLLQKAFGKLFKDKEKGILFVEKNFGKFQLW